MRIASISEDQNFEKRIAITPEIAKKYVSLGFEVTLSEGYGQHLGINDDEYTKHGTKISRDEKEIIKNANIIVQLGLPTEDKSSLSYKFKTKLNIFFANKLDAEIGSLLRILLSPITLTPSLSIILSTSVMAVLPP